MTRSICEWLHRLAGASGGSVTTVFAIATVPLIGITGLAVDFARIAQTRTALQSAADTAALAGAAARFGTSTQVSDSSDISSAVGQSFYNSYANYNTASLPFNTGVTAATTAVQVTPSPTAVPITVTGTATATVPTTLLAIWAPTVNVSATAAATASAVSGGPVIPFAVDSCLFSDPSVWNSATNTPVSGVTVTFDSSYHSNGSCLYGQWTSLTVDSNSQSYVKGLMNNGSGTQISVGTNIYIQPGTKAASYGDLGSCCENEVVLMPVVAADTSKTLEPVLALVPF